MKKFYRLLIIINVIFLIFVSKLGRTDNVQFVPVLMYHEIVTDGKAPGETVISLERFEEQMRYLAENGYTTLSMDELIEFMKGKKEVPLKSVVLNFDDGWEEQLKAIPALKKHHFKASFWVITGEGFDDLYLDWPYIIAIDLDPNFEVGSHTVTHPWDPQSSLLTWLEGKPEGKSHADVWKELRTSKKILEKKLRRKVTKLAWPCGWYNDQLVNMAKETGYDALLTTIQKGNVKGDDVFRIKRFFVDGRCNLEDFRLILEKGESAHCQEK